MSQKNSASGSGTAILIRRLLIVLCIFAMTGLYLLVAFSGLTEPMAMDQAQIAREVARGNDLSTKCVRPLAIHQANMRENEIAPLLGMYDTYHAPLNPLVLAAVFKLVGIEKFEDYRMSSTDIIYGPDRVVAALGVIFFLMSIGVTYLLVSRIFDTKIAGVTVVLMLFCDLMWNFSLSGLPQMLMLLLFTCGLFFSYQATEKTSEGQIATVQILQAGVFFCLMALAHWLAVWMVLGFAIYTAVALRPRGLGALLVGGMLALFSSYFIYKNVEWTGNPAGTAGSTIYGGLVGSEQSVMRALNPEEESYQIIYQMKSIILNMVKNILSQSDGFYTNIGAILAAPIFFFSLLHPFKKVSIARFRWLILLMWGTLLIGLALFGLSENGVSSNQLHILFAPIMSAYGLAFVSILWSRLNIPAALGGLKHGHFIIIILISIGPLVISLPKKIVDSISAAKNDGRGQIVWPYYPQMLNSKLHNITNEDDIIVTDQPWAVAWYADRIAVWLPRTISEFEEIERIAKDQDLEVAGVFITPSSLEENPLYGQRAFHNSEEFAALMLDGTNMAVAGIRTFRNLDQKLTDFNKRYQYAEHIYWGRLFWYGKKAVVTD